MQESPYIVRRYIELCRVSYMYIEFVRDHIVDIAKR